MSRRKHRRAEAESDGRDLAALQAEVRAEVRTWQTREEQLQAEWRLAEGLAPSQRTAYFNSRTPNARRRDRSMRHVTTCQLPNCERPTIRLMGTPLGVCVQHGIDIAVYFDTMVDESPLRDAERAERELKARARTDAQELRAARAAESRRNHPGWIYYLLIDGRIKIGYSVDVRRRLKSYPPDSPLLALHPGTKQLEGEVHAKFAGSKAAGREWFLDTPELREHIKRVIEDFGEPDRARYEHRGQHKDMRHRKAS